VSEEDIVVYIDDSEEQLELMPKRLAIAFGEGIRIEPLEPACTIVETIEILLKHYHGALAFVFDEKMHDTGKANFDGSDLAIELRDVLTDVPIYILTSFVSDEALSERFAAYDYVIDKGFLNTTDIAPKLKSALQRNIGRYKVYISKRSEEMHELLEKSVVEELSPEESEKLSELLAWQRKPVHILEHQMQVDLKAELDKRNEQMDSIEKELSKLEIKK